MKIQSIPKIAWATITFLVFVIAANIGGIVSRRLNPNWDAMADVRLKYDLFFGGGLSLLCLTVIAGLLLRKNWGRELAVVVCFALLFMHFIMRLAVYLYFLVTSEQSIIVLDPDAIVISVISFMLLISLTRPGCKELYTTTNIKTG